MRRTIGAVLTALAVTVPVAACQGGTTQPTGTTAPAGPPVAQDTSVRMDTVSPITQAPPRTSAAMTSAPPQDVPVTSGHGLCVDINSGVVHAALMSLGPAPGGEPYIPDQASSEPLGSCPQLLWVLAATPGGTASSPWHVLFFNHSGYLGTATAKATAYTSVVGSADRSVQVRYRWLTGDDANCCPSGGPVVITFALGADGRTVTPDRPIPPEVAR
ncbi:LppP/LprE family lipoprotein [Nocardia transvalensis]|uniref:LppP/LprE family lipoprotein n=1 Tax=Nocardia transvalensis TaxID=37333 RepID=UPI0018938322|nr:LppP/LprE family lipoprotein [Nocardia transvalensis]MBF6331672.1 LppP/LprE family lipoprotein [Nocardia transvalensis]